MGRRYFQPTLWMDRNRKCHAPRGTPTPITLSVLVYSGTYYVSKFYKTTLAAMGQVDAMGDCKYRKDGKRRRARADAPTHAVVRVLTGFWLVGMHLSCNLLPECLCLRVRGHAFDCLCPRIHGLRITGRSWSDTVRYWRC